MGLTVVDASVVLAVLDPNDAHHPAALEALKEAARQRIHTLTLPASAYAEVLVHPAKAGPAAVDIVRRFCTERLQVEPLSVEIAEAAADLRAHHAPLRLPDALVIATAHTLHADVLLTTDRRWAHYSPQTAIVG